MPFEAIPPVKTSCSAVYIKNLTVEYKNPASTVTALKNITLGVDKGDICAIIGPSGCGKSTLLHVLSGITKASSGEVFINGRPVNPKLQRIGLIPQNFGLLEWSTVFENSVMGLRIKKESLKYYEEHIENILQKLGISELRQRYPSGLSGGQKQRVSIARSFILNPDILLMDEPFSALDAMTREEMQDLFLDIWKANRVTTFFVTHSIEEALYMGRKIVVFSPAPGRIVKTIDNPFFGMDDLRFKKEFYDLSVYMRKVLKEEWQNG